MDVLLPKLTLAQRLTLSDFKLLAITSLGVKSENKTCFLLKVSVLRGARLPYEKPHREPLTATVLV